MSNFIFPSEGTDLSVRPLTEISGIFGIMESTKGVEKRTILLGWSYISQGHIIMNVVNLPSCVIGFIIWLRKSIGCDWPKEGNLPSIALHCKLVPCSNCSRIKQALAIFRDFLNITRYTISLHNYKRIRSGVGINTQTVSPGIDSYSSQTDFIKWFYQTIDTSDTLGGPLCKQQATSCVYGAF